MADSDPKVPDTPVDAPPDETPPVGDAVLGIAYDVATFEDFANIDNPVVYVEVPVGGNQKKIGLQALPFDRFQELLTQYALNAKARGGGAAKANNRFTYQLLSEAIVEPPLTEEQRRAFQGLAAKWPSHIVTGIMQKISALQGFAPEDVEASIEEGEDLFGPGEEKTGT